MLKMLALFFVSNSLIHFLASHAPFQLRILDKIQMPFRVKGGAHATNPGFSSTSGVQIAMRRFKDEPR
ncbi:hypothetical protein DFS33DRAFT_237454 [Desarmillaria ectypa]|nr:hypothetical protein DFS33DRAFT_237454 [Desarmillaria ectypa]